MRPTNRLSEVPRQTLKYYIEGAPNSHIMGGTVSSSSGCVQEALSQSELSNTLKQLGELSREPLEPTELSLEPTPDAAGHPLALLLNAPRSLKLDDVEFSISESLRFPFRLVRVTVYVLPQAVPSQKSDVSHTIMRLISCMALRATLELPAATLQRSQQWFYFLGQSPATDPVSIKLQTCIRDSNADSCGESRHGCCVLVEIPVPAGIVLRPGTEILLTASIAGTRTGLRIPAYGHIHSTSCNHTRARGGAVLLAAQTGSRVALEAALASGGSTEEVDYVRS